MRPYNFCAGPAALPDAVMLKAQSEFLNWQGKGASVFEISHRSAAVQHLVETATQNVKTLLSVPDNYAILFMHGGANSQFFSVPMNLFGNKAKAAYLDTGVWSRKAMQEAKRYGDIDCVARLDESKTPWAIPDKATWQYAKDNVYFYYTENETITGVQFPKTPEVDIPLVSDMTSSLFSKPVAVSKFAVLYAGFQKNIGPAGSVLVIVRKDLLNQALPITPTIFNYAAQAKAHSAVNTLSAFNIYIANLMFEWVLAQGGLEAMAKINARKAKKLYAVIDQYDLYKTKVDPAYRSTMNVTFFLPNDDITAQFLGQAAKRDLLNLKGHRSIGGVRASLYNAVTEQAVDALIRFMHDFAKEH